MFCPNCGKEMNEGAVFCPNCGFKNTNIRANASNKSKSSIIKYVMILLCIVIGCFAVKSILFNGGNASLVVISEESKCKNDFDKAMNYLKQGDINSLKNCIAGGNLGSIDDLLSILSVDTNSMTDICKALFKSYDYDIENINDDGSNKYTIKTKISVPGAEYITALTNKIVSKFDITDLGILFGARESKVSSIVNRIIDAYDEVDAKNYKENSVYFDVKMVKEDGKYKINNFSSFLNNSQIGKIIDSIKPVLSSINSFLN